MANEWSPEFAGLLERLNRAEDHQIVPEVERYLQHTVGATHARMLFADIREESLTEWRGPQGPDGRPISLAIEGSPQGRVYRSGRPEALDLDRTPGVIAPVIVRTERIGVLEVRLSMPADEHALSLTSALGVLLGYVVVAADRWMDGFHVARRRQDMSLPAEVQWALLPLAAFASKRISIAGALEPAYDVGGDTYDYTCGDGSLLVGLFDAMGHGLMAARLSALVASAFRNARRRGDPLGEQASFIDRKVADVFDREGFVTGLVLSIDLNDPQRSQIVNAGHLVPMLQRGSAPPVRLKLQAGHPFGFPFPEPLAVQDLPLAPGDRITLYTDGLVDAHPDDGEAFGEGRLVGHLIELRELSPRETVRHLVASVRQYRAGDLMDDATVVVVDVAAHAATGPAG